MKRSFVTSLLMIGLVFLSPAQDRKQAIRPRGADSGEVSRAKTRPQGSKRQEPKPERKEARSPREDSGPSKNGPENHPERIRPAEPEREFKQDPVGQEAHDVVGKRSDQRRVFDTVRDGLNGGKISSLTELLAPQVHVNLKGGETGYFSAGQAYYVLENYFQTKKISGLEFSTLDESGVTPYATGSAGFQHKGTRENAQVYISLSQSGERWVITQIKIY